MSRFRKILASNVSFGGGLGFTQPDFWSLDSQPLWTTSRPEREQLEHNFESYVQHAMKANGVVFACVAARQMVFSEARFQFQKIRNGRPGQLFGTQELDLLERPWRGGTTGELLARMEQDISLAGNWFGAVRGAGKDRRIRRLRPDWVTIVTGSPSGDPLDIDAEVVGYIYNPKPHRDNRAAPLLLKRDEVAHWSPIPDPEAQWRGMSWITPVMREIHGDSAATDHKLAFFRNGTTSNFVVTYPETMPVEVVKRYAEAMAGLHDGTANAYKTLHFGGGADVTTVGADLKQLDFKATQGAGETRIAAASGLGAVMAQLSEGLSGSSLNAGNFDAARKRAETTLFRPLWRGASATLEQLVKLPGPDVRLAPDLRDVAFLRADAKAEAEITQMDANTMESLYRANWKPESIVEFMVSDGDYSVLEHTGMSSVQGQPTAEGEDA